jgi:hypothetical protein
LSIETTHSILLVGAILMMIITGFLSVSSVGLYVDYVSDDYSGVSIFALICYVPMLIFMSVAAGMVAFAATGLMEFLERPMHRRAGYILVGFPIVLVSFTFSSIYDAFVPSMIFGWPLFIMATILVPTCAWAVKGGLDFRSWTVACWGCGKALTLRPSAPIVCCPKCGSFNSRGPEVASASPVPPTPAPSEGPLPRDGE